MQVERKDGKVETEMRGENHTRETQGLFSISFMNFHFFISTVCSFFCFFSLARWLFSLHIGKWMERRRLKEEEVPQRRIPVTAFFLSLALCGVCENLAASSSSAWLIAEIFLLSRVGSWGEKLTRSVRRECLFSQGFSTQILLLFTRSQKLFASSRE